MARNERPEEGDAAPAPGVTVLESEIEAAASIPAVLTNRMIATNTAVGMRVSFGEQQSPESPTNFRFATIIGYDDAKALADLLVRQLALVQSVKVKVGPDGKVVVDE